MSIIKTNIEGPSRPDCGKKNKYIILVVADGKGSTAKKAKAAAMADMKTERNNQYASVKKKSCPAKCKNGDWDRRENKQDQITNTKIGKNPTIYYSLVYGTTIDTLTCPEPPEKKKK